MIEIWDLWFPGAGATGMSFARSSVDSEIANDRLLVHAAPSNLSVTVLSDDGGVLAFLVRRDREVMLEDGWPTEADLGTLVILPGGEAGILQTWWNAADKSEWRWSVEFYNHT